jgi:hypothetical protein
VAVHALTLSYTNSSGQQVPEVTHTSRTQQRVAPEITNTGEIMSNENNEDRVKNARRVVIGMGIVLVLLVALTIFNGWGYVFC